MFHISFVLFLEPLTLDSTRLDRENYIATNKQMKSIHYNMKNQSHVLDLICHDISFLLPGNTNLISHIACNTILSCLVVFINTCIVTVIWRTRKLQTPSNILLLNNAIADTILGISVLFSWTPFLILAMTHGKPCLFYEISFMTINGSGQVSLSNLTLIALDRYVAIHKPFFYTERIQHNLNMYIKAMTFLWIITLFMVGGAYFTPNYILLIGYSALNIGIAYALSSYVYINIYFTVRKINRTISALQNDAFRTRKKEIRLAKITIVMLFMLTISFVPFGYITILWMYDNKLITREIYTLLIWSSTIFLLKCLIHALLFSCALSSIRIRIFTMLKMSSVSPESTAVDNKTRRVVAETTVGEVEETNL